MKLLIVSLNISANFESFKDRTSNAELNEILKNTIKIRRFCKLNR